MRPMAARLTAAALLALGITAAGVLPTHAAEPVSPPAGSPSPAQAQAAYDLKVNSNAATTDYGHRKVNLDGVLTRADGTPVAGAAVSLREANVFLTWNPWGDPINPYYRESFALGTVKTDPNGRFTLPNTPVDYKGQSYLHRITRDVEIYAEYDPDADPTTDNTVWGSVVLKAKPVASTLTYKVNKHTVRTGNTLTVTGTVKWPAGHGSVAGTPVFLRAYYESQWNAKTTTKANGQFSFTYKVQDGDNDFAVFSAPKDFYIAGKSYQLPVKHVP
jgi:hypothetical protein